MTIKVEPIKPHERVHCAYCNKPLQPNHGCRKTFYSMTVEAAGQTCEEQLAAYQTNRRVVRIARSYHVRYDDNDKPISRKVTKIEVVHFPDPDDWGFWGVFCGQQCAARFGYVSHRAGYRITKRKAA